MALLKLEIAVDYPVEWEFSRVFRDLVQNFYDSLKPEKFAEGLHYEITREKRTYHVVMETQGTEFSYEWLTYVGGSTKTDKPGEYIGKYGEGFKMAALRIMQMGGMSLTMHSQNWCIAPVTYAETIDGREISMLGYDYHEAADDGITRLELTGISLEYQNVLEEALLDFCYPENELFGACLGRGQTWEVYERSKKKIPCRQKAADLKGILYINNLARGRLDIPVIINYKRELFLDSRSRETFNDETTADYLHEAAKQFDAATSLKVLKLLQRRWNEYPKDIYDINTKYYLVCQLVRNIAKDAAVSAEFWKKYQNLAYIDRKGSDVIRNRLIDETKAWAKDHNARRLVNPVFRLLGATSLLEEYQQEKDALYRSPTDLEWKRASVLYEAATSLIPLLLTDKMPEIVIDENAAVVWNPLQFASKNLKRIKGQKNKKYEIHKLAFRHEDFYDDAYLDTLVKMSEALLHEYGSDRSSTLTVILTHLGQWILDGSEVVDAYECRWKEAAGEKYTLPSGNLLVE